MLLKKSAWKNFKVNLIFITYLPLKSLISDLRLSDLIFIVYSPLKIMIFHYQILWKDIWLAKFYDRYVIKFFTIITIEQGLLEYKQKNSDLNFEKILTQFKIQINWFKIWFLDILSNCNVHTLEITICTWFTKIYRLNLYHLWIIIMV